MESQQEISEIKENQDFFAKNFPKINNWDISLSKKIYFRFNSPQQKKIAKLVSFLGDPRLWGPLIVSFGIYGLFTEDFSYMVIFFTGFLQTFITYQILKLSIKRPRPFHQFEDISRHDKTGFGHSFPSGHCHHSVILIGLIGIVFVPYWWFILIILIYNFSIALSRIINGLHFPSDCIFGTIEAYIELLFFYFFCREWYITLFYTIWNFLFL